MQNENKGDGQSRQWRRILLAIFGAIVVGAVGSGVWDVVAKPGLSSAANLLLRILASGSDKIRDLPYSMAALNPYSLPSLLLFLACASAPAYACGRATISLLPDRLYMKLFLDEEVWRRRQRQLAGVLFLYGFVLIAVGFTSLSILNRAIAVRRIYDANMEIIAPYVPSEEVLRLRSEFASMVSQADYFALKAQLKAVAAAHKVRLRDEEI